MYNIGCVHINESDIPDLKAKYSYSIETFERATSLAHYQHYLDEEPTPKVVEATVEVGEFYMDLSFDLTEPRQSSFYSWVTMSLEVYAKQETPLEEGQVALKEILDQIEIPLQ